MRIVGGIFRGRTFNPGKSFKARPTTDFAKENLFNILENRIDWESTKALDLFAGTGSISYELISRGCLHVTAVEMNFRHCKFIEEVKSQLGITNIRVVRDDANHFIAKWKEQFDLIFVDPPFDVSYFNEIPVNILESGLLKPEGLLVIEHNKFQDLSYLPGFMELRTYGSVNFSFLRSARSETT